MNFIDKTPESASEQKYSIQKLSLYIDKFLKVLEIDLGRLHQHRRNIEKYSRLDDLYSLNKEQVNAGRTVQQIKANIKELEKARSRIIDEDLSKFDAKLKHVKEKALTAITEYIDDGRSAEEEESDAEVCDSILTSNLMQQRRRSNETDYMSEEFVPHSLPVELERGSHISQLQVYNVPQDSQAAESWQNLKENLVDLNQMVHDFSSLVENQQEKIDQIEENLETAHDNIQAGAKNLSKSAKIKTAMIPLAGAIVGGIVGGPIGFVACAKLGGVAAAMGGGLIGFVGGKILKRRRQSVAEMEMNNLSKKGSVSLPDLSAVKEEANLKA
ncbi:syntaxin-17-like isoform X1 [Octopus vulgaris]|uniref:Syntaxin-17-like isoform X1 n=1 Tax=Octopus vulgaris TaxID=6645 RepID=A0AA36BSW6_OCTVU|nr:syntaxin-17-like isoform X1 [Octopus vulgaris]